MMSGADLPAQGGRGEQYKFADHLEACQGDPIVSFVVLKAGLQLDSLGSSVGIKYEDTNGPIRPISDASRLGIDALRRLTILFSRHGKLDMPEQGKWLNRPNRDLWIGDEQQTPLRFLRFGAQIGPNKNNIYRIVSASIDDILPRDLSNPAVNEAWAAVDVGAGVFNTELLEG